VSMTPTVGPMPATDPGQQDATDLRAVGDRIETLLEASSAGGIVARERAEELVRLVADLYGAGLERMLEIADEVGALTDELLDRYANDDLVASLLLVHGLHPEGVDTRVQRALDSVRPYLESHGGDVELLEITADGVARLRLLGSCDGCASSATTMSLAVQDAISTAAPEVTGFEVESPSAATARPAGRGLIPLEVVGPRQPTADPGPGSWQSVPGLEALSAGEVLGTTVAGISLVVCRIGADLFAFRDECARCGGSLAAAVIERRMGAAGGTGVLRCPSCKAHYDVRHAGSAVDDGGSHLEPLPLLERRGHIEVAVPAREAR
jgi:Fe-S cluster biogenesis protein NfuA/nitrite reductase/ring-hydroxylating ferredoxin subunit